MLIFSGHTRESARKNADLSSPSINRNANGSLAVVLSDVDVGVPRAINSNSPKGIFLRASRSLVSLIEVGSTRVCRLPNSEITAESVPLRTHYETT